MIIALFPKMSTRHQRQKLDEDKQLWRKNDYFKREYASRMAHPEQAAFGGALNIHDCLFILIA
jgi:hypothetical protein